ncbi:hypothetical protein GJV76_06780 [Myroides sp. BIT-d1]|uniref:Uncharacterized protein n=1 Tax=Myroides albus TaxID=2562892 RepID=A0A6I3LJ42_9FLAO|nr:hypothetical protein [Myroides albus]MTG97847.1 hypothetical protein [Myroides albus]
MSICKLLSLFSFVLVGVGVHAQRGNAAQMYIEYAKGYNGSDIMTELRMKSIDTTITKYYQAVIPVSDKDPWTNKVVYSTKKEKDKFIINRIVYSKEIEGSSNRVNMSSKSVYTNGYGKNSLFTIKTSTYLENGWMSYYEIGDSKSVISCYDSTGKLLSKTSGCLDTEEDFFESMDLAQSVAFLLKLTEQRILKEIAFKQDTPLVMVFTIDPVSKKKNLYFSDLVPYGISKEKIELIQTAYKSLFFQLDMDLFTYPRYLNGQKAVLRYPIPVSFKASQGVSKH